MKATLYSKKWMGENVSEYGIENGYIDYRCLAHVVGDIVLCNDITKLFYSTINGEYTEPEQVNGYIDNTDEIEELEREQDEQPEIYQYYIICDNGADFLQRYTNEIIYYIEILDIYVWGITHFGTSWDYVLTDIKIENESED